MKKSLRFLLLLEIAILAPLVVVCLIEVMTDPVAANALPSWVLPVCGVLLGAMCILAARLKEDQ